MNPWPVEAGDRGGAPAAARPRRPGRRAEVRLQRRARHARARHRARDGRSRGRRRAVQGVPARARRRGRLARRPDRRRARARARARAGARGLRRGRHLAGALPGCRGFARDGRARSTSCARPNESLGGVFEVQRLRPGHRASARTSPGRSASTGAWRWRSARSRPSRASRSATASPWPACRARTPTTRSSTPRARLLPRDQPRGRAGGRDDERRAADRRAVR